MAFNCAWVLNFDLSNMLVHCLTTAEVKLFKETVPYITALHQPVLFSLEYVMMPRLSVKAKPFADEILIKERVT